MPELRKDPIVGRWVIISTDRAKRPTDFVRENMKIKGGFCPFVMGTRARRLPRFRRTVRIRMAGRARSAIRRDGRCASFPTSFLRSGLKEL